MNPCNFKNITTNSTGTLSTTTSVLATVTVNTKGSSSNTLKLTSGANTIATIDTTSLVGDWYFNALCTAGIQFTMATGTPADVTIMWT